MWIFIEKYFTSILNKAHLRCIVKTSLFRNGSFLFKLVHWVDPPFYGSTSIKKITERTELFVSTQKIHSLGVLEWRFPWVSLPTAFADMLLHFAPGQRTWWIFPRWSMVPIKPTGGSSKEAANIRLVRRWTAAPYAWEIPCTSDYMHRWTATGNRTYLLVLQETKTLSKNVNI